MGNVIQAEASKSSSEPTELLTCLVGEQWIGIRVQNVREVVTKQLRTEMPLSPDCVMGLINLRGKVITEIEVRTVVGLPPRPEGMALHVAIVETCNGEDFGLIVDDVGEVVELDLDNFEATPRSLGSIWIQVSEGVIKQQSRVIVVVNVDRFISLTIPVPIAVSHDEDIS
ncbi:MAG: chemotaxis protein CheW [Mariprofundales bacterium]|nr:chemotaxis protein CheW [Mariprofundales bacterium]